MPKKKSSKKRVTSPRNEQAKSHIFIGLAVVSLGFIGLLTVTSFTLGSTHVLGASTLLARGGDDSSGDSSGGGSNSGSESSGGSTSGSSNTSGSSSSGGGTSGSSNISGSSTTQTVSGGTVVNCTGPDGKVFQTTASNCESLNKQWNHPVSFTVANTSTRVTTLQPTHIETVSKKSQKSAGTVKEEDKNNELETEVESEQEPLEVLSKDEQVKVNLKKHGTVIELRTSQGRIALQANQVDGTKVELGDDSIKTLNNELAKQNKSEIEQDVNGAFVLRHKSIKAKTTLPISVNLATKELIVTTSKGVRVVAILPDVAVNKLITLKVIDSIEPEIKDMLKLTELNDTAVFEIKGIDDQRLLGIVPVKIHKTVHISAEDGTVEATNESFGQRLLDLLSF